MARPNKKDSDKLVAVLPPIRCTSQEGHLIRQNAKSAGLSLSEYIRNVALQGQVHEGASSQKVGNDNAPSPDLQEDLFYHLHRIGNNLNQLTKLYHQKKQNPKDLQNVLVRLDALFTHILEEKKS